jgi:hypothetical protein
MSILFVILISPLTIYHDYRHAIKLTQAQIEKRSILPALQAPAERLRRLRGRAVLAQVPKKGAFF